MRCCVPGCKSDSRHLSKSQGITFHVFPAERAIRAAWVRALGRVNWEPKERSVVCSEHFLFEDLYETASGLRKVQGGAVPFVLQVCRICLIMNRKLFSIRQHRLEQAYEHLTGLTLGVEDKLPEKLCYECAHRLLNCRKFRNKSLRAHSLLTELFTKHDHLTMQNLRSINRENNLLTSSLGTKIFTPDHHDVHVNTENAQTLIVDSTKQIEDLNLDLEVKDESNNGTQIFIDENDDFSSQADEVKDEIDLENNDFNSQADEIKDEIVIENDGFINDNHSNHSDKDFNLSDKEYSSDDSIPLERRRRKKILRKKTAKQKTEKKDSVKKVRKKAAKESNEPKIDRRRKPFLNGDLNETLFTITDLTFEEQVAEINKRQESANYKNSVFKCTECFKGFLDEDAYNGHMTRHTKQCGEHQCDICKTHFKHSHALRKHITAHHTQRFSCNQCPYVTTHRQTARLHERWHKGTKYQCPHCQDEFVKFTTYMGHIRIKHPSDFVCQLCGYSFVSAKGIELHKKLKHRLQQVEIPEDGPFCELCNVRFVSPEAHRQHLRVSARHNTSDKDSREANKPKGRKSKEAKERERKARDKLEKEMGDSRRVYPSQMRKAEGPIPCEQCGIQLEDSRAYHSHFRRMHPDKNRTNYPSMKSPCMCEVCGRMFQSYALLKDHRWTHTGERPFKCDACGKAFRMKQRLVAHRRVHSQVKTSYVCNLCGKHFSTHSNRQRHMFIHTGLKPFKCEMCDKGFKHASEKRAHITYVHLKKPWPKRSRGKRRGDRQGSEPPDVHPASASEMDIAQPIWPPCDPKMDHMPPLIEDKAVYYNLKI